MNKYDNMKNSNLPWIKEIPSHWKITRIKEILQNVSEKNHPNATVLSLYREYGVLPKDSRDDNHNVTSLDTASYKFVRTGELVINKMKAWQGSLGVSDYEGIVSPAYYVCHFTSDKVNPKYLHYLLRCNAYAQEFERLSTGMRIGQWDLGIDDFMCTSTLIPPLDEQTAIVSYLDEQCAKIDNLIDEIQNSIEEYKAWKTSLISETITKGLVRNIEMKESGIAWIGKIPASWTLCKQKYVIRLINGRAYKDTEFEENGKYKVLRVGNLFTNSKWYTSSLELDPEKYCDAGDLLYAWSASYGPCIWQGKKVIYHYHIWKTELSQKLDKMFAYYYFIALSRSIASESHGSAMAHVTMGNMNNSYIAYPDIKQQMEIADYLNMKCAAIDKLISEKESILADLFDYKKSLIYEVVTGKRKVV